MSFYLYVEINTGNGFHEVEEVGNGTHNLQPMYTAALGHPLRELHERPCHDVIGQLERAYAYLCDPENRGSLTAMEPPNGWGKLADAQAMIAGLLVACRTHPKCRIHYSG